MFTGIITNTAKILSFEDNKLVINLDHLEKDIVLGESIAINGVCLTVVKINTENNSLVFDVSDETISCTNFAKLEPEQYVNIERSLQLNSRLSGHLVTGHVDSVCNIVNIEKANDSYIFNFEVQDKDFLKYIAKKDSICLDGISLTVNGVQDGCFWVTIIPHTFENTNLKYKTIGDIINFEVDLIARYVNNFKQY